MLTIIDLGHKPRSCCYLIELELYPHSEHQPIHILVDAPIEISDILDFVPNEIPSGLYFGSGSRKQFQNKINWHLDESGKQWIIGNKRFKNSPFYFTVPFKKTSIKNNNNNNNNNENRKNTDSKKRKLSSNNNNNNDSEALPSILNQNKIFIDIVLISNHESIVGLPYLFKIDKNDQDKPSINHCLNNMDNDDNMNDLLQSLLSTDPITMDDIYDIDDTMNNKKEMDGMDEMDEKDEKLDDNYIEIGMSAHCKIYATEPTKQYGKLLMKSLASSNNQYFVLNSNSNNTECNKLYDMDLIEKCMNNIITVQYNESISILSGNELEIICISSGLYIGSSNWIIRGLSVPISIGIVMGSCGATNRHPKSITLSPHFDAVGNIDLVLIDDLQSISLNDESANDSLQLMEKKIIDTILNKGSIIIPTSSCGVSYDMLERIHSMLNKYDYTHIAIYFISSIAKESISYSSIYGEWLHKTHMKHVSDAKYPFGFQTYIAHNRLIHCTDWNNQFCFKYIKSNLNESRIIICDSPSLRYGNILHLLNIFNHSKNTLILTDPRFNPHLALYPFNNDYNNNNNNNDNDKNDKSPQNEQQQQSTTHQLKLQIVSYPIDARLQIKELCVLLRKVCPKYAFIPNNYYKRIMQNMNKFINTNTLLINKQKLNQQNQAQHPHNLISPILLERIKNIKYFTMSNGIYHCIQLNDDETNKTKTLYIDSLISQNIYPKNINPNHSNNMFIASLSGNIDYNTNIKKLILRNKDFVNEKCVVNKTFIGTLNIDGLLNNLKIQETRFGFTNIQQIKTNIISLEINHNKKIQILTSENVTNIRCDSPLNKENLTNILDLVSQHLVSF